MRGYFTFILVFVSLLLVFTMLLSVSKSDFSQAVAIERAYGLSMNIKEILIESARQGANEGFAIYDNNHDIRLCRHCQDHFCTYDRDYPNYCDDHLCSICFRENDARASAIQTAQQKITNLKNHKFDPDFSVSFTDPQLSVFLKPSKLSKNGFSLDYMSVDGEIPIILSSKFISTKSKLPKLVISCH
ncbi:Uncharacterised protein [Candidatus Bilamarchaeum dharawalense]|uniref:Uncharacterized protein n=1 Tax=Candidatus Bilamarchaeum dharawalense TaxID=2885759 RepID=A0A5E4LQ16_9ARCH|nr:Uncharacterised protein [Candidatus Bilamarchaeum dharawalense]